MIALLLMSLLATCGPDGTAATATLRHENRLKNRTAKPTSYQTVLIAQMVGAKSNPTRWAETVAGRVEGIVLSVKKAGVESCNCFSTSKVDHHIELKDPKGAGVVVVEITPRVPIVPPKAGDHVIVEGWMFFDAHHETQPGRQTAWEVHPVTSFTEVK